MKSIFSLFILAFSVSVFAPISKAQDLRSDSMDILHTHIALDLTDISGKRLQGSSTLTINPKMNKRYLNVDLLKLNIDSVLLNNSILNFTYDDTLLSIDMGATFNGNDTLDVTVYYQGTPQIDASNWGGFYFNSGTAFNLGVGFEADPHNYGRVWFPCFDNFIERSTFTFDIISSNGKKAYCNGEFVSETVISGDTISRKWDMKEPIPSYLVCVAVSDYSEVNWSYQGLQRSIPVQIAVKAADTNKLKSSFIHLDDAMDVFERWFGPYQFNKIGYSIVPFNAGAMEHASNITYPNYAVNGNTNNETLMAHELAHMWWGDLVTCSNAGDMWINEGMASYCEQLFIEDVYDRDEYIQAVKDNLIDVLQYAHIVEDQYWAISGVPHEHTYGMHSYDKGAVVAHNIRAYLGDTVYAQAMQSFLANNHFSPVSSSDLHSHVNNIVGGYWSDFYLHQVFRPGFVHMSVDSIHYDPDSTSENDEVFISNKLKGDSNTVAWAAPISIGFYNDAFSNPLIVKSIYRSTFTSLKFNLPFEPTLIVVNPDQHVNMAMTSDQILATSTGSYELVQSKMEVELTAVSDSIMLNLEHHWVAPDNVVHPDYRLSNYRYWSVTGMEAGSWAADAVLEFDGRTTTNGGAGYLDNDLLINGPDSIILMYRKGPGHEWKEYPYYTKVNIGSLPFGRMELDSLIFGEYTFANGVSSLSVQEKTDPENKFSIAPNPSSSSIRVSDLSKDSTSKQLTLYNLNGRKVFEGNMQQSTELDVSNYAAGNYILTIIKGGKQIYAKQVTVSH